MEEHRKQLNHLLTIGKFMILYNVRHYIKEHHEMLKGMTEKLKKELSDSVDLTKDILKGHLSDINYCNAWLNYAEKNSNLLQFNNKAIDSISKYPNYDHCLKDAREAMDSWYDHCLKDAWEAMNSWYNDLLKNESK